MIGIWSSSVLIAFQLILVNGLKNKDETLIDQQNLPWVMLHIKSSLVDVKDRRLECGETPIVFGGRVCALMSWVFPRDDGR